MRSRTSLLLVALLACFGCDTLVDDPATASLSAQPNGSHEISLDGSLRGDVYFDLAPIAPGNTFSAHLTGDEGRLTLRHEATSGRKGLVTLTSSSPMSGVSVSYRSNGTTVGTYTPPTQNAGDGGYEAGQTDREPDSVHYIRQGDIVIIEYDYDDADGGSQSGTSIQAPDGRTHAVTHVRFTIQNGTLGRPGTLAFDTPSEFAVQSSEFAAE